MFTNSSVGVVFWNKVFSSDTVSGYKCSHFLVTMHSLLLGIFIKKTKMESFCTKTSPVQGGNGYAFVRPIRVVRIPVFRKIGFINPN